MRNRVALLLCLSPGILAASCGTAPQVNVTKEGNLEKAVKAQKIVIVSDAGKYTDYLYQRYFLDSMAKLTKDTKKNVCIMTDNEFLNSPYARSNVQDICGDTLFVQVNTMGREEREMGAYDLKCMLEIRYRGQAPIFTQEITAGIGSDFVEARWARADQFAKTIYNTLKSRNIL